VFPTQLRKVGSSWVVTVPREEWERLGIWEGATVTVEVCQARASVEPVLAADLREASAWALEHGRAGLDALAEPAEGCRLDVPDQHRPSGDAARQARHLDRVAASIRRRRRT
jgi:antitoxin component of MazEF toxin-antitoxin module